MLLRVQTNPASARGSPRAVTPRNLRSPQQNARRELLTPVRSAFRHFADYARPLLIADDASLGSRPEAISVRVKKLWQLMDLVDSPARMEREMAMPGWVKGVWALLVQQTRSDLRNDTSMPTRTRFEQLAASDRFKHERLLVAKRGHTRSPATQRPVRRCANIDQAVVFVIA